MILIKVKELAANQEFQVYFKSTNLHCLVLEFLKVKESLANMKIFVDRGQVLYVEVNVLKSQT